jgi:hypothetical protein
MLMMCANAGGSPPPCIDGFLSYVNNYYFNYGVADITITQDLTSLYALDYADFKIKWYDRNVTTGAITIANSFSTLSEYPDFILSSPLDANNVVQNVYVWSRTVDNTNLYYISTYERTPNAGSWQLDLIDKTQVNLSGAEFYGKPILSPNGSNAYSLGNTTNYQNQQPVIITYGSPPNSGMYVQSVLNLQTIGNGNSIEISPNGKHLYMFGSTNQYGSNELRIFSRNLSTGILTFISPLSTLNRSYITAKLLFSPDSLSVYVVDTSSSGPSYSTIDKYSRNDSTGALTYVSTFSTGVDIRDAVISKNGESIYTENIPFLSHYIVSSNAITFSDSVALSQFGITNGLTVSYDSKFLYHPDITNNMPYFSTDVCPSITFKFVAENDPNSVYSISAVELGMVNGKKFFSQIGTPANYSSHIFWNGTYWFYNRGNGTTIYFNSTDSELPPSGLWQPASDLPPGPWIPAQGFTTGTLTYEYIYTPPFVEPDYLCVTGNSGYNNPSFNGQYYGYGGAGWVHIGVSWQTNDGSTISNSATFYTQSTSAYESTTGLTGFYDSLDTNIFGYPAPTVSLGSC